ncbi:hypothetical protein [Pandoraea sp. NPDC087047]|uniref:hypothetical protein n=1 Tax=Pandoraea sp. NPDC087047 TaxID=3364390 RepID=UPI003807665E
MLVANLVTPTAGNLPRALASDPLGADLHSPRDAALGHATRAVNASAAAFVPDDVDIRPVERLYIKSDYTMTDLLKAVATARAPFENLADSLGDAYAVLSEQAPDPVERERLRRGGEVLDLTTGLIPEVKMLRLPGHIAQIALNQIEGKLLQLGEASDMMQYLDPKAMAGVARVPKAHHTVEAVEVMPAPVGARSAPARLAPAPRHPGRSRDEAAAPRTGAAPPEVHGAPDASQGSGGSGALIDELSDELSDGGAASQPRMFIEGESEYLAGYEQQIAPDRLPSGEPGRFAVVDGHHFIAGENGYYRVSRDQRDDIWLVDAPNRDRARVPLTFDPASRQWKAQAPLRLCGGGCHQSRHLAKSDSIAERWPEIASSIAHLADEDTQNTIRAAYGNLGSLRLLRGNRDDLRGARDYSIVGHRAALQRAMRGIDRNAPLLQQQQQVAATTAMYYSYNPLAEAFCQENAEILFHLLLESGIPKERLRMISIHPQNRPSHVMVLYTESEPFIRMLHLATPSAQMRGRPDGIGDRMFARAIFLTRESTLLLDPWGKTKATGFSTAASDRDVQIALDRLLTNIGRRDQRHFAVSITRPFATRPRGINSVNSPTGSAVSSVSALDPSVEPDDLSSSSVGSDAAI